MLDGLKIQLFQDGARIDDIKNAVQNSPLIRGFTTNPTLMRAAGVTDYAAFAQEAIEVAGDLSISFEVFSDDFEEMEREARIIKSWGGNTCVKIPITNTKGASSVPLIERLSGDGISCNVTAIFTTRQVAETAAVLVAEVPSIVSVFAGRVADTGVDPMPLMTETVGILADNDGAQALWASPREL
ncbi:MAG: transaldolase, partial [Rhodospirillaceae bacterium]|nr:transaldolase [Rhodospirillaceae bacterium]